MLTNILYDTDLNVKVMCVSTPSVDLLGMTQVKSARYKELEERCQCFRFTNIHTLFHWFYSFGC